MDKLPCKDFLPSLSVQSYSVVEVHNEHMNPTMHPTFYTMLLKAGLLIERSLNGFYL